MQQTFFEDEFEPAVHIAQLENTQYAECLLAALNDGIHKKMHAKHHLPLASQMRLTFGPNKWEVDPAAAKQQTIDQDLLLLATAGEKPFELDDYLIAEDKAAAVSEEAIALQKVNAVKQETNATLSELKSTYDARFEKVEAAVESTKAEIKAVDTKVDTAVSALAKMMAKLDKSDEHQQEFQKKVLEKLESGGGSGGRSRRWGKGQRDKSKVKCFECGTMGHYANECPDKSGETTASSAAVQHTDSPPSQVEKSEIATAGSPQRSAGSRALNDSHTPSAETDCRSVQEAEAFQGAWHVNLGDQQQLAAISSVVNLLTDTKNSVQSKGQPGELRLTCQHVLATVQVRGGRSFTLQVTQEHAG